MKFESYRKVDNAGTKPSHFHEWVIKAPAKLIPRPALARSTVRGTGGKSCARCGRVRKFLIGVIVTVIFMNIPILSMLAAEERNYAAEAKALEKNIYTKEDLGAVYTPLSTTFKVWSPTASLVKLKVYATGSDNEEGARKLSEDRMAYDEKTGVWSITKKGDLKNLYYTYVIADEFVAVETVDIYAKAVGANGNRAMVVDLSETNPDGWDKDNHVLPNSQTDAIIWEVQIKDFSYSVSSGVSEQNRGKYLAFTETGTVLNGIPGNPSTCVDYLKQLGITHVQINPFYDFASVDETGSSYQYNWGYDPKNYNVPEGSFSSDPYDGNVRIKECKEMIKALHDAGIGVVMDVVYNHTFESEESWFNITVPNYYYRINKDGTWSEGSGCGNDTSSERYMFRKFMIDSVLYWIREYHVDGFRFDLMGLHDVETMNEIRSAIDKLENGEKILMYGEAWDLKTTADPGTVLANQSNMSKLNDRIAAFNDTMRDASKGSVFQLSQSGFIQNGNKTANLKTGILAQSPPSSGWAKSPSQTVTYVSCHDNNTLYDKLAGSVYGNNADYNVRYQDLTDMNKLAGAIVFTSQGIPFMLAGEEMARSKNGDKNSYRSSPEINAIAWENLKLYSDIAAYYKGLIKIRKSFAPFSDSTNASAENIKFFENAGKGVVGYTIENVLSDNGWQKAAVIFNGNPDKDVEVDIEYDKDVSNWVIVADNKIAGIYSLGSIKGGESVLVPKSSALILIDKESFEKSSLTDDEKLVIAEYFDENNQRVNAETISGRFGDDYIVSTNNSFLMKYDIVSAKGQTEGVFTDDVSYVSYKCEKYTGNYSKAIIRFIDTKTNEPIAEDMTMTNRVGQQYFTPYLPVFENYKLVQEALPENIAGKFTDLDTIIIFRYEKDEAFKGIGTVNVFYVSPDGKVIEKKTLTGLIGESYTVDKKAFEGFTPAETDFSVPSVFSKNEINILMNYYEKEPEKSSSKLPVVISVVAGTVFALVLCGIIISVFAKKRAIKKAMNMENGEDNLMIDESGN